MTTIVAKTTSQDDGAPVLLTADALANVAGGLRLSDFILPKLPPYVKLDPVEPVS